MRKTFFTMSLILALLNTSQAAVYTLNATVDLQTLTGGGGTWTAPSAPLGATYNLNPGDSVDINITFLNNERLVLTSQGGFDLVSFSLGGGSINGSFSPTNFSFTDATGDPKNNGFFFGLRTVPIGYYARSFGDASRPVGHEVSFTGFSGRTTAATTGVATNLTLGSLRIETGSVTIVPEPSALALTSLGLIGLLGLRHRRVQA